GAVMQPVDHEPAHRAHREAHGNRLDRSRKKTGERRAPGIGSYSPIRRGTAQKWQAFGRGEGRQYGGDEKTASFAGAFLWGHGRKLAVAGRWVKDPMPGCFWSVRGAAPIGDFSLLCLGSSLG